jgi:steroid delta-isomerase-like uncharacterized protein
MPTPAQAQAIERYSTEVWAQGNLDAIDDIFASDYVRHGPALEGGTSEGAKSLKELVGVYRTAFPDLQVPVEASTGEGDVVITRWSATGTNTGEMLGIPPTGKPIEIFGFWMHRFEGGQIVEEWATWDTHGFLAQMDVTLP